MRATVTAARVDSGQTASGQTGSGPTGSDEEQSFRFGFDAPVFAGHFPAEPILPGVFQIEMARQAAEAELDRSLAITRIVKAKFSRVIKPEELVKVVVKCEQREGCIRAVATFTVGGKAAGKCALELTAPDGDRP